MAAALEGRALLGMARDNKTADIKAAVRLGVPVDYANPIGQTALMVAALWGNLEAVATLLELGADVNKTNQGGATPLHFAAAAKRNAAAAVDALLAAGADPSASDSVGCLPFERADDPAVRIKLGGPDPRLFEFAAAGDAEGIRGLLTSGAVKSLRASDPDGRHALTLAAGAGEEAAAAVELILEIDPGLAAVPDMTGNCPLHAAAEAGNEAAARALLRVLGPEDIDQRNLQLSEYSQGSWSSGAEEIAPWDKTPLALAVEAGDEAMTQLLLDAGADPNIPGFDGACPLHAAVAAGDEGIAALLLEKGADANRPAKDVRSALHSAAQRGPASLLALLLAHGADASAANEGGWTPLHLAARAGSAEKIKALLAAGADASAATSAGHTAAGLAAANGKEAARALLEAAAAGAAAGAGGKAAAAVAAAAPA
ncbi:hypothetical protein Rsub_04052 [Raphidocelis subcapitata]|uniref:Uncharacterized protein n=1 Tax=Raphidocelis subcapitata TaxID=307507 RepID=A0A2V0NVS7_9CHLO|nr:hypothetical protein Rsub_04052 [Raphidocelis subcapitata]|eukprot:GBF91748.1 hypothetical protein Rsub_04052 [Raphidocelis subcapitata]